MQIAGLFWFTFKVLYLYIESWWGCVQQQWRGSLFIPAHKNSFLIVSNMHDCMSGCVYFLNLKLRHSGKFPYFVWHYNRLYTKRERERERNSSVEGSCDKRRHESLSIKMCVKTCRAVIIQLLLGSRYSGLSTSRDFRSKYTCCHISVPMITCAQTG